MKNKYKIGDLLVSPYTGIVYLLTRIFGDKYTLSYRIKDRNKDDYIIYGFDQIHGLTQKPYNYLHYPVMQDEE